MTGGEGCVIALSAPWPWSCASTEGSKLAVASDIDDVGRDAVVDRHLLEVLEPSLESVGGVAALGRAGRVSAERGDREDGDGQSRRNSARIGGSPLLSSLISKKG